MQSKQDALYQLLNTELGLSRDEADRYFTVTEEEDNTVLEFHPNSYLETKSWKAFIELMQKLGAVHSSEKSPVFTIPNTVEAKSEDETPSYSLAASREGLGELAPVLKDAFGNVIDGFHRLGENAQWHAITVPTIDNPVKLELARLAVNFNRRKVSPEELAQRITYLVKSGVKPDEIAEKTGISKATIYRYMPQEFKDPTKVEAGKAGAEAKNAKVSALTCEHTVNTSDTEIHSNVFPDKKTHDQLVEALDTANHPFCPECCNEPINISSMGLPYVVCKNGHEWHLSKGSIIQKKTPPKDICVNCQKEKTCDKTKRHLNQDQTEYVCTYKFEAKKETGSYLDRFEECRECHLMFDKTTLVDGKCRVCTEKEAEKTPIGKEPSQNAMEELGISTANEEETVTITHRSKEVPCETCGNDSEQGGDCHREFFEAGPNNNYVCSHKKPLKSQQTETSPLDRTQTAINTVKQIGETQNVFGDVVENAFTVCYCPLCEAEMPRGSYELLKQKFGDAYPELFLCNPKTEQKIITCGCGQEILIVPDIKEMSKAIHTHAETCIDLEAVEGGTQKIELDLTQQLLATIAGQEA